MSSAKDKIIQYSTFYVAGRLYGIDVTTVQEVVRQIAMTPIPLAEKYVKGLINLRGQVVTAIGLQELFEIERKNPENLMNVICKSSDSPISLLVDEIGDVLEFSSKSFEPTPSTIPNSIKRFMNGVYKKDDILLSIIDIQKINQILININENAA